LRVRRFRSRDIDGVMAVERASFGRDAWPRDLLLEYTVSCPELFLVAETEGVGEGEIAGYAAGLIRGARAELASIAVHPDYRRAGAGKTLLVSTLRRLRARKVGRLHLMVKVTNRAALRFYQSFGFRTLRRMPRYYEDGRDGFLMTRAV
jgi:ribosomal-protein-alanine N-acetyltransferase